LTDGSTELSDKPLDELEDLLENDWDEDTALNITITPPEQEKPPSKLPIKTLATFIIVSLTALLEVFRNWILKK